MQMMGEPMDTHCRHCGKSYDELRKQYEALGFIPLTFSGWLQWAGHRKTESALEKVQLDELNAAMMRYREKHKRQS